MGMPRLTQNAKRSSRNSASTRNTSANPAKPLCSMSESWLFSDSASFCQTVSDTPSGRRACASATYSVARAAMSIALLVSRAEDGDHHRRLDVELGLLIGLLEPVDHRRHVAEAQAAAVGPRPQHQVLELRPAVRLPDRPQQDLPPLRPHRPARQVQRRAPNRIRHLVERHPVPPQVVLRDLDRDLVGRRAHDVDLRDARGRGQLVPHPLRDLLQRERVHVAGDRDVDDLATDAMRLRVGIDYDGAAHVLGGARAAF